MRKVRCVISFRATRVILIIFGIRDLDQKLNSSLKWFNPDIASKIIQSKHLEFRLETDTSVETFLNLIKTVFVDDGVRFGIVGLHACGDLTVDVMRLFLQAKRQAVFLNIFGCCYHKLSDRFDKL